VGWERGSGALRAHVDTTLAKGGQAELQADSTLARFSCALVLKGMFIPRYLKAQTEPHLCERRRHGEAAQEEGRQTGTEGLVGQLQPLPTIDTAPLCPLCQTKQSHSRHRTPGVFLLTIVNLCNSLPPVFRCVWLCD